MLRYFATALFTIGLALVISDAARAETRSPAPDAKPDGADEGPKTICGLIEEAAAAEGIPVEFLTRLIWKESTFQPSAVSPKGAEGIAQFMPDTAAARRLSDPFDPKEAVPASARYLKDLAAKFGNLGLAAAAYNAGEARVAGWLANGGGLPFETEDYVLSITGRTAEEWSIRDPNLIAGGAAARPGRQAACLELAAILAKPGVGSEPVPDIAKAPWAPWGVQVAGNFSLSRAMASYSAMQKRYSAILGAGAPMVVRAVNKSRGRAPLFQIRLPAGSREAAAGLCQRLHAAGGACVVIRN
jgi:hypothetical protein